MGRRKRTRAVVVAARVVLVRCGGLAPAKEQVGDCPDFRAAKMGLSPCEVRQLFFRRSLACCAARCAASQKGLQVVHGGDEVGFLHGHGELDRIEVRLTREAAAQVGAGIDRGELFLATGAEERQLSLAELMRPIELLQ